MTDISEDMIEIPDFNPLRANIVGHLFENPLVNLSRNLYWSLQIDFEEFFIDNFKETPNCLADWFLIENPEKLNHGELHLDEATQSIAEVSCYLQSNHFPCINWSFSLTSGAQEWLPKITYQAEVDLEYLGVSSEYPLIFTGEIPTDGFEIIIVKNNLEPKIETEKDARLALEKYFSPTGDFLCVDEEWRYVFRPKAKVDT